MQVIHSKAVKNPEQFTGAVAQSDLQRSGYISLTFTVTRFGIGVDVAGFAASPFYDFSRTANKQANKLFYERYIAASDKQAELDAIIKSNQHAHTRLT